MGLPWLTSAIAAAIRSRINLRSPGLERNKALDMFDMFLQECRRSTAQSIPYRAFGLEFERWLGNQAI